MPNRTQIAHSNEYFEMVKGLPDDFIAWVGGWIGAHGAIKPATKYGPASVQFGTIDRDPLERMAERLGGRVFGPLPPRGFGKKPIYQWALRGEDALIVLDRCWKWLPERAKERAKAAMKDRGQKHVGNKLSPDDVRQIREELRNGKHGIGRALARRYKVSDRMISAIRHGRAWPESLPDTRSYSFGAGVCAD